VPDNPQGKPILDAEALKHFDETVEQVRAEIKSLVEPVRRSAQLTEGDYSIRINARD
jgi:hypothetical protein